MARRKKVTTETVKDAALELLDLTLQAAKERFRVALQDEYPIDAATISASVALLKLTEAKTSLGDDDKEHDLAAHRKAFAERRPTQTQHSPDDIVALYAGNN